MSLTASQSEIDRVVEEVLRDSKPGFWRLRTLTRLGADDYIVVAAIALCLTLLGGIFFAGWFQL